MSIDNETTSSWFTLSAGFKVYGRCPACHSPRISYFKTRHPGLQGISASSKGLTPACIDCGNKLPTQIAKEQKVKLVRIKKFCSK